jgi:hypothetical protein
MGSHAVAAPGATYRISLVTAVELRRARSVLGWMTGTAADSATDTAAVLAAVLAVVTRSSGPRCGRFTKDFTDAPRLSTRQALGARVSRIVNRESETNSDS